jgi:hypothetical protein
MIKFLVTRALSPSRVSSSSAASRGTPIVLRIIDKVPLASSSPSTVVIVQYFRKRPDEVTGFLALMQHVIENLLYVKLVQEPWEKEDTGVPADDKEDLSCPVFIQ